jgi:hypothetical protein
MASKSKSDPSFLFKRCKSGTQTPLEAWVALAGSLHLRLPLTLADAVGTHRAQAQLPPFDNWCAGTFLQIQDTANNQRLHSSFSVCAVR